jgi:hypothetical protein
MMRRYPIVNKRLSLNERSRPFLALAAGLLLARVSGSKVFYPVPGFRPYPRRGQITLKRLILLASFAVLFTPYMASAHDWNGGGRSPHRKIGADQMATVGLAAAAMIGVAGYLVLRKRTTT